MILKNNLRVLRFNHNEITQQQLADKVGVSRQTINSIEKGKFNPSVKLSILISEVLEVEIKNIFYIEREMN